VILTVLFTFFLTVLFTMYILEHAKSFDLVDIPNQRSSHDTPKPRGAGIGMFLSFVLTSILFYHDFFLENCTFYISLFIVFTAGLLDDVKDVSPKLKFIFIIAAVVLLFFTTDLKITSLGVWFGKDLTLPFAISLFFTIFVVVGYTNALNLIDGLDGLAGGISLIIFLTFLYLGYIYHDDFIIYVSLIMSVSIFAFLFFNWYPAKIFMGDSGSLLLGYTISVVAIKLIQHIHTIPILFLAALPILDTIMVMVRRIQRGMSPFKADKSHIHHKVLKWKTKVDYSVMLLLLIQVSFSLLGILIAMQSNFINLLIYLIVLKIVFYVFDDRKIPRKNKLFSVHTKLIDLLLEQKYRYILLLGLLVGVCFISLLLT